MRRRLRNVTAISVNDVKEAKASLCLAEQECSFAPFQWNLLQSMKSVMDYIDQPFEGKITTGEPQPLRHV